MQKSDFVPLFFPRSAKSEIRAKLPAGCGQLATRFDKPDNRQIRPSSSENLLWRRQFGIVLRFSNKLHYING
jgi:hypothetical protein